MQYVLPLNLTASSPPSALITRVSRVRRARPCRFSRCIAQHEGADAAAQGVLEGAGGVVLQLDGESFSYPARESLLNASFLALPAKAPWRDKLLALAKV